MSIVVVVIIIIIIIIIVDFVRFDKEHNDAREKQTTKNKERAETSITTQQIVEK